MHRPVIFIAAALAAVSPAVAHAGLDLSRPVRLAEVSADPRDGDDTIELRGLRGFTHLELRARDALVDIHGLGLRLHDGRIEWMDVRARLEPGEQRTIELPYEARRAEAIVVDYGDPAARRQDRTPARLELYGAALEDCGDRFHDRELDLRGSDRRVQVYDRDLRGRRYRRAPDWRSRPIAPDGWQYGAASVR